MAHLIFDFDGTIGDSFELVMEIAYELTGIQPLDHLEVSRLRHLPIMKAIRELGVPLHRVPRLLLHGRHLMSERMQEVHPFAGIPQTLQRLHEQGHDLRILSSNSEQNVRSFLQANGLEHYFASVHGGVGVLNKAAAIKKVLRHDQLQADACFYIGDEVRDVIAAQKVHVRSIAVSWGYQAADALRTHRPFAIVATPGELVELFIDN
jgi:phosphoglycolate phosphatase